jgi:hypothetical protein
VVKRCQKLTKPSLEASSAVLATTRPREGADPTILNGSHAGSDREKGDGAQVFNELLLEATIPHGCAFESRLDVKAFKAFHQYTYGNPSCSRARVHSMMKRIYAYSRQKVAARLSQLRHQPREVP